MPSPEGYMPSPEEQTLSSKEKEERLYSGRIVSSIRDADNLPIEELKETMELDQEQFDVIRNIAYDAEGKPLDEEFRHNIARAAEALSHKVKLLGLTQTGLSELIYRQYDEDAARYNYPK